MKLRFSKIYARLVLMLVALTSLTLVSCDDSDGPIPESYYLIGTWDGHMLYQTASGRWVEGIYRYNFNANGTGYGQWVYPVMGEAELINNYYVANGQLFIQWTGTYGYNYKGPINIFSNYFTIQFEPGEPWITFNRVY